MNRRTVKTIFVLFISFFLGATTIQGQTASSIPRISYIDAHNHLSGGSAHQSDFSSAAIIALREMDHLGIGRIIIMPPPFSFGHRGRFEVHALIPLKEKYPDRIAVLGGGGSLNIMIHQTPNPAQVTPELKTEFKKTAEDLLAIGAIGFGELAVDHFSFAFDHPYESVPADHPLLLLLAEIGASHNVPIDIHMEVIPTDMPLPDRRILQRSGNNPKMLKENLSAFERLLAHNPKARIIWAHVGWCNTGFRTPDLCRRLLSKHPNLYMSFKLSPESVPETRPIGEDKKSLKPEWLQLLKDFPDRFIIGTDQFYVPPGSRSIGPQKTEATKLFMTLLPPDLARQIGQENPSRIFNLKN
jgi:hypothetical protein